MQIMMKGRETAGCIYNIVRNMLSKNANKIHTVQAYKLATHTHTNTYMCFVRIHNDSRHNFPRTDVLLCDHWVSMAEWVCVRMSPSMGMRVNDSQHKIPITSIDIQ